MEEGFMIILGKRKRKKERIVKGKARKEKQREEEKRAIKLEKRGAR